MVEIPESDWKIFRAIRERALERFCRQVLEDVRGFGQMNRRVITAATAPFTAYCRSETASSNMPSIRRGGRRC